MEPGWRLGPHGYAPETRLVPPGGAVPGCAWRVVRREGDGSRWLLQLWDPCPPAPVLDVFKDEFLHRFSRTEPLDPGACHLGCDQDKAWLLQELCGVPLPRVWARADAAGRRDLRAWVAAALSGPGAARVAAPEAVGIEPGQVLAPRVLGPSPWGPEALFAQLGRDGPAPPGALARERPWAEPPEWSAAARRPLRGRARELTYLKSLVLGLGAAVPMERVLVLQGEAGLGHTRLCDWAAAVAETEGLWVADLDLRPGETAGDLLGRMTGELIKGLEADLYAARPAVARGLARRLATFGFLAGGSRAATRARRVEPAETAAALEAMAFAQERHPRLVLVRGLERPAPDAAALVADLALRSRMPWLLSVRDPGLGPEGQGTLGPEARAALGAVRDHPDTAVVVLDRLEDGALLEVLDDLLSPHDLSRDQRARLGAAGLGNPGLLRRFLEAAQAKGAIRCERGRWSCPPGAWPALEGQEALGAELLRGRLRRLRPGALAAVRCLALADEPLGLADLGRALRLDPDATEEALHSAVTARLALWADGAARIQGPGVRDLVLEQMPEAEQAHCARTLLELLGGDGGRPLLAVRLQAFALDRDTALGKLLEAVERERPGPGEAERILREALRLEPEPAQRARLLECLADAWCLATEGDGLGPGGPCPWERSLDALERAAGALAADPGWAAEETRARLHRKHGLLDLRLRRPDRAEAELRQAAALLADHPFHPEQPRLRLAQGRLHWERGSRARAAAACADGLALLRQRGPGADARDQAALLLELARAQGEGARFQDALDVLDAVLRLAEHGADLRLRAQALGVLGLVLMGMGRPEEAEARLREAAGLARSLDDPGLLAEFQLDLGACWSWRQRLGPAQACLDGALGGFGLLGDRARAAQVQAWQARNLTALGDPGQGDLLLIQAAGAGGATPMELGERAFLEAESAGFLGAWSQARRHYQAAASRFEHAGLVWRNRLARLRCIQAEVLEAASQGEPSGKSAWIRLEQLKETVAGSGSGWLDLEWRRAHALLLAAARAQGPGPAEALLAWGQVLAGAREQGFPALVLDAGTRSAELLLGQGERLGARARVQDAAAGLQELCAGLPQASRPAFLGRSDILAFREAAERAGMTISWPPADDPLPDWNVARPGMARAPSLRAKP